MPTFGHIDPYDTKEDISSYLERVEQFFIANSLIPGDDDNAAATKQAAIFLTSIGKIAYNVIQNLCRPKLPKDSSYDELCKILKDHFIVIVIVIIPQLDWKLLKLLNSILEVFNNPKRLYHNMCPDCVV